MIKKTIALTVLSLVTANVFAAQSQAKGALIFNTSEKYPLTVVYQVCAHDICLTKQEVTIPSKAQNKTNYINVKPALSEVDGARLAYVNIISAQAKDEAGKVVAENTSLNCEDNFSTEIDQMPFGRVITLSDMNSPYVVCQPSGRF